MEIKKVEVGSLKTNCYILVQDNKCLIIDPGDEFDKIDSMIHDLIISGIVITHYHYDHTGALDLLIKKYRPHVYDKNNLEEKEHEIGPFKFDVIYTPGHKEDAITLYFKNQKAMFVGDFIFKDTIGRTDLLGGSVIDMNKSISKIKKYPDDITIYPGHGENTTLEHEKTSNYYFII